MPVAAAAALFVLLWQLVVIVGDYEAFILPGPVAEHCVKATGVTVSMDLWFRDSGLEADMQRYLFVFVALVVAFSALRLGGCPAAPALPSQHTLADVNSPVVDQIGFDHLMTGGLMMKTALFPAHFWLPPAHSSAPAPVSAALSGLVVKAGFYVLLRLWFEVFDGCVSFGAAQLMGALVDLRLHFQPVFLNLFFCNPLG